MKVRSRQLRTFEASSASPGGHRGAALSTPFFYHGLPSLSRWEVVAIVLLLILRCSRCGVFFHVCRRCYRGQRYCGPSCGLAARRCFHRAAQKRYRQTPRGRQCRREAARRHRRLHAKRSVDDAGSTPGWVPVIFPTSPVATCRFCGRAGRVVKRFPRRGYGRGRRTADSTIRRL